MKDFTNINFEFHLQLYRVWFIDINSSKIDTVSIINFNSREIEIKYGSFKLFYRSRSTHQ